jgi:hypothetical protein
MRYFVIFAGMFLVLACTSVVMAAPVSGDFTKPTDPTLPDWFSATSGGVDIGGGTGIGIYIDPKAGPWLKQIVGISVSPLPITETVNIVADPATIPPLPGGPPWTDWDELIMTQGWQWAPNASLTITESDGITVKNVAGILKTVNFLNDLVEFDFNPAENPGASLFITKQLRYNGPGLPQNATVWIAEYPTPEPATIVLLISGLLALGLGYIRRR